MRALLIVAMLIVGTAGAVDADELAARLQAPVPDLVVLKRGCNGLGIELIMLEGRAAELTRIGKLPPERQSLAWLLFLEDESNARFTLRLQAPAQDISDRIRAALVAAVFPAKVEAFDNATRTDDTSDGSRMTNIALPATFGTKADLVADILAYVRRTPPLANCLAEARRAFPDRDRWDLVIHRLIAATHDGVEPGDFPANDRIIWLGFQYVGEVENGGVEQFFMNSSGLDAPETADALRKVGLADQAAVLDKAVSLFGPTFPDSRSALSDASMAPGIGEQLDQLSKQVDADAIDKAMVAFAKRVGALPP